MQTPHERELQRDFLTIIREDMPVYEQDGRRIGNVKYVHPIDGNDDKREATLDRLAHIPSEIQGRLLNSGFIQIDCGLLQPDCYATPDQITRIQDDGVHLNIGRDQLMTF
jgi:hypothetical protein